MVQVPRQLDTLTARVTQKQQCTASATLPATVALQGIKVVDEPLSALAQHAKIPISFR